MTSLVSVSAASDATRAGRIAAIAQLRSLELQELQWEVHPPGEPLDWSAGGLSADLDIELNQSRLPGQLNFGVIARIGGSLADGSRLFDMKSRHVAAFALDPGHEPTIEEIEAFSRTSVLLLTYPYVRQIAQELTTRAGFRH